MTTERAIEIGGVTMLALALFAAAAHPAAVSTYVHVLEDGVVKTTLMARVTPAADGSVPPVKFAIVRAPTHGGVTLDEDTGDLTYVPQPNYNGVDSLRFTVNGVDIGVVRVDVVPVNDPPTAQSEHVTAPRVGMVTLHLRAQDVEGAPLRYVLADRDAAANPELRLNEKTGELVYRTSGRRPAGRDVIRFFVYDGEKRSSVATATIDVR